jgi:hypothetical protein
MQDDLTTVFWSLLTGKITLIRRIEELQATGTNRVTMKQIGREIVPPFLVRAFRKLNRWDDV